MSHTNDPLLNAKKCWTRAGPNFLPLGWAKKQLCNQFLNTITRSKVAWLPTDILFLGPVLNYKLPWNWFKRVIINWVSSFVSKLKSPWWCLFHYQNLITYKWALISSSRTFKFSQFIQVNTKTFSTSDIPYTKIWHSTFCTFLNIIIISIDNHNKLMHILLFSNFCTAVISDGFCRKVECPKVMFWNHWWYLLYYFFLFYIMDTPVFYNGVWQKISHAFSGDTI